MTGPTSTAATTTATPATTRLGAANVVVYFLRDGKVAPVSRSVPLTPQIATAALQQLDSGLTPSDTRLGLTDAYRGGVALTGISGGIARLDLTEDLSHAALAQVVYTLTQFPTVRGVRTSRMLGDEPPITRATFEDVTPSILVESPLPDEHVTSPLHVTGTANAFEATFVLEIRNSSNQVLSRKTVTATSGSGTRGTFDTTVSFTATGSIWLVAYEASAENGKPLHTVRIPLAAG